MAKVVTYEPAKLSETIREQITKRNTQGAIVSHIEVTHLELDQLISEGAAVWRATVRGGPLFKYLGWEFPIKVVENDKKSRSRRRIKGDGRDVVV